jgi:Fur family transcriptional regulator, stress-responsive regulator
VMGELRQLDLGTGSSRFDPNTGEHHHLVCDACGAVQDVTADFPGVALDPLDAFGYEVASTEIVFRGRCRACAGTTDADASFPDPINPNHSNEERVPHG